MGGGGSSSKNYTTNNLTMKPVTNIDFDVESIAEALRQSNQDNLSIEEVKANLTRAGLALEAEKTQLDVKNAQSELALKDKEIQLDYLSSAEMQKNLKYGAFAIGGYLIYKNMRKKKK